MISSMREAHIWRHIILATVAIAMTSCVVASSLTSGAAVNDDYMTGCRQDLGMYTGAIADSAITASSAYDEKSVGPKNARIRTERNGGAWCPRPQIGRDSYEWLEIDLGELKVISVVETQGRFGNGQGQEFAPNFMLDYQREPGTPWFRFRDRKGTELLKGNINTFLAELRELRPPIVARRIRFVPYSSHPRTVCMRVELYGCTSTDGLVSYDMRQGDRRGTDMEFFDFTYDGSITNDQLTGGLGQLADYEIGEANFRLDNQNLGRKGYEWVGWRNDSGSTITTTASRPVEIIFRFDQVRNFSAVVITCNNMPSREVSVFRSARIYFSVGGVHYSTPSVVNEPSRDDVDSVRQVIVSVVPNRPGRYVRLVLTFDLRWIMISEVHFISERVNGTIDVEQGPTGVDVEPSVDTDEDDVNSKEGGEGYDLDDASRPSDHHQRQFQTSSSSSLSSVGEMLEIEPRRRLDDTYVGIIVGALAVFIVLIVVISTVIAIRLRRKKYGNGGSTGSPSKFIYSRGVTGNGSTCRIVGSIAGEKSFMIGNGSGPYNTIVVDLDNRLNKEIMSQSDVNRQRNIGEHGFGKLDNGRVSDFNVYASLKGPLEPTIMASVVTPNDFSPSAASTHTSALPPPYLTHVSRSGECPSVNISATNGSFMDNEFIETSPAWDSLADLEFPRENLVLVEILGDGVFGEVVLCDAAIPISNSNGRRGTKRQRVAVKSLRRSATKQLEWNFFREVEVMFGLQDPNLAHVLGVCSQDNEPVSVIVEYLDFGDLHQFLVESIPEQIVPASGSVQSHRTLSYGCLIYMATQIASGMKYLETLNIVHRDLATRNCLVGNKYGIKISDFGRCRSVYSSDYYHVEGKALMPIRWMAWESMLMDRFSCKTDVWSFAVTLWEVLTFARDRPYQTLNDAQVVENCSRCAAGRQLGVQLPQPPGCPREIYDLMAECWQRDADRRPTFREIHMFLQRKNMGYSPTDEFRPIVDLDGGYGSSNTAALETMTNGRTHHGAAVET